MKTEWRVRIGCAVCGIISGLFIGGFIWNKPVSKEEVQLSFNATTSAVREARLVVTAIVERTVFVDRWLKADKRETTEERRPDGTVIIATTEYGLGIVTQEAQSERLEIGTASREQSDVSLGVNQELKTVVKSQDRWMIGGLIVREIGSDFLRASVSARDLAGVVGYRPFEAPFWGVGLVGPRFVGLGFGMSF
jgi:hypothetical protein